MLEHGVFRLELERQVLHSYPVGGFNKPGLLKYRKAVLDAVRGVPRWILFEHPGNDAGLTGDALPALIETYHQVTAQGCVGIACQVGPLFRDLITDAVGSSLAIPLLLSEDTQELEQFVHSLLDGI